MIFGGRRLVVPERAVGFSPRLKTWGTPTCLPTSEDVGHPDLPTHV
jgi:hypothetical protein